MKEFLTKFEKNISFQEESLKDQEFLLSLYASSREDELSMSSMSHIEKKNFINQQFRLKESDYKQKFKDANFLIIKRKKQNIGRLAIDEKDEYIHLIDISISKKLRGKGFGKLILKKIISNAQSKDKLFKLSVFIDNLKAISLYKNLGLQIAKTENYYHYMQT